MKSLVAAAAVFGMCAGTAHAADNAPRVFKPAGQWVADYGDDYCRLSRDFSDGGDTFTLAFERIQPGPSLRMILVGIDFKHYRNATTIGWRFTPTDQERTSSPNRSKTADGKDWINFGSFTLDPSAEPGLIDRAIHVISSDIHPPSSKGSFDPTSTPPLPPAYDRNTEQVMAKGMTGLIFDGGLPTPVEIQTGSLGAPIAALQACADDLAKSWGVDSARDKTRTTPAWPQNGPAGWLPTGVITFEDFPKLGNGANQVRLLIDATGKPSNCHINWPSLDKGANDKICEALMEKASFVPAKDATGQPMAGYWVASPLSMLPLSMLPPGRKHH